MEAALWIISIIVAVAGVIGIVTLAIEAHVENMEQEKKAMTEHYERSKKEFDEYMSWTRSEIAIQKHLPWRKKNADH